MYLTMYMICAYNYDSVVYMSLYIYIHITYTYVYIYIYRYQLPRICHFRRFHKRDVHLSESAHDKHSFSAPAAWFH